MLEISGRPRRLESVPGNHISVQLQSWLSEKKRWMTHEEWSEVLTFFIMTDKINQLICHREMFPYSLNSSQPLGNKWRRQKSLEAEFNTRIVLRIAVNVCHLGSMHSNLCVYRSKMAAVMFVTVVMDVLPPKSKDTAIERYLGKPLFAIFVYRSYGNAD